MRRFRIVHLVQCGPTTGGTVSHVALQVRHQVAEELEVVVACASDGVLANSSRAAGAQVVVAPGLLPNADADAVADSVGLICEAVGDQRPSLIHSHLIQAGFVGRAVARNLEAPQVYTQHMYNSLDPFVRTVAGRGDAPDMIAVSRMGYTEISKFAGGAGSVHLVPNGVDRPSGSGFRLRLGPGPNLLYCGRLSPEKGVDVALLAFARIRDRHRAAVLHIVGTGPDESVLRMMSDELGIGDSVEFYGSVADAMH